MSAQPDPVRRIDELLQRQTDAILRATAHMRHQREQVIPTVTRQLCEVMRALAANWRMVTPDDLLDNERFDAGQRMAATVALKACALELEQTADRLQLIDCDPDDGDPS